MSWAFAVSGHPSKVRGKAAAHFKPEVLKLAEPEMSIALKALDLIEASLANYPETMPVKIDASGSQSQQGTDIVHTFSLAITPMWGFLHHE